MEEKRIAFAGLGSGKGLLTALALEKALAEQTGKAQTIGRVLQDGDDTSPIVIDLATEEGKAQLAQLKDYAAKNNIVLDTPDKIDESYIDHLEQQEKRKRAFDAIQFAMANASLHGIGTGRRAFGPGDRFYTHLSYKRVNGKFKVKR